MKRLMLLVVALCVSTMAMAQYESSHPQLSTYVYGGTVLDLPWQ